MTVRAIMPASPSTISSCCLRGLPDVASPTPGCRHGPAPSSWRGQLEPVTALTPASGRPTWPPGGQAEQRTQHLSAASDQAWTRAGTSELRPAHRWPQPTDVSPERGPHSSPHTPLNAGARPLTFQSHAYRRSMPVHLQPAAAHPQKPTPRPRPAVAHRFRLSLCGSAWRRGEDRTTCCGWPAASSVCRPTRRER